MPKSHDDFLLALRKRESSNNYTAVNKPKFLGAYQMGEEALQEAGYYRADNTKQTNDWQSDHWTGKNGIRSIDDFLQNREIQDSAVEAFHSKLFGYVKSVHQYDGQTIDGIKLTISSLVAGAHLVGNGKESNYLSSDKTGPVPVDGNETPITEYWKLFSGYDMSFSINHEKAEKIIGSTGKDILSGKGGNDRVSGGDGNDVIDGGTGKDILGGGIGKDRMDGGDGNDTLRGNEDIDTIGGGKGDDIIIGGEGRDQLAGGEGKDIFVFDNITDKGDFINDFDYKNDKIRIDANEFSIKSDDSLAVVYVSNSDIATSIGVLVYEFGTGNLYNGFGSGADLIATLDAGIDFLTSDNFLIS